MSKEHFDMVQGSANIDVKNDLFPFCIVWTPIPFLTWFIPIIGHMGIATSSGIIRDFAGPYFVSEGNFAFGRPTKYYQLNPMLCQAGITGWDSGVAEASEIYKTRMHNLCFDNCHSHCATALNIMQYKNASTWNMVKMAWMITLYGKYVSLCGFIKTWLPFCVLTTSIALIINLYY